MFGATAPGLQPAGVGETSIPLPPEVNVKVGFDPTSGTVVRILLHPMFVILGFGMFGASLAQGEIVLQHGLGPLPPSPYG